jgi:hypothetical protein
MNSAWGQAHDFAKLAQGAAVSGDERLASGAIIDQRSRT